MVSTPTSRAVSALPPKLTQPLVSPAASRVRARQWYCAPFTRPVTVTTPWTAAPVDATAGPATRPVPLNAVPTGLISTSGVSVSTGLASTIVNLRTTLVWFVQAPGASVVAPSLLNCASATGRSGAVFAAAPTPFTPSEGLSPPVNVTSLTTAPAAVGLKRTVTVCVWPAVSEYAPPDTMLNGVAVLASPVRVPVPVFLTTKVRSADEPTVTVPKSCVAGVTSIAGCGAWPAVQSNEVPSASAGVWKLNMVPTSGDTWTPTVAVAPWSRSVHSPPKTVSR